VSRSSAALVALLLTLALAPGCAGSTGQGSSGGSHVDPTPEKLDGTGSFEFERDDLDRAAGASDRVKEYCAGAASEAQRVGCESHVTEADIP
jgi:hypothetical protein